jgi:hypothetical protein
MRYSKEKIKELTGVEIKGDYGYLEVLEEKQYKSRQQNALFHSLLMCFWESKLSSFESYEDLRNHYKRVAHLCDVKWDNRLKDTTKTILWKAIKMLPLPQSELAEIIELIKGRVITWRSWGDCSKEMARLTLDQLIGDMVNAGVNSKKFQEIMRELDEKKTNTFA